MPCKREARFRHNTIAFWLSDEEKRMVEAKIIITEYGHEAPRSGGVFYIIEKRNQMVYN